MRFEIIGTRGAQPAGRAQGKGELEIFDVQGRSVQRIAVDLDAGEVAWDGRDAASVAAPAGVYFLRLQAGESSAQRKVVLLR